LIDIQGLSKDFQSGDETLHILRGVDLQVGKGEMLAIVGASGVGKSTFLHIVGGLERPTSGTVRFGETDVYSMTTDQIARFRNERVGFVFQFHHLLPEFDAVENAEMPLRIARLPLAEARGRATQLLERVGLSGRLTHRPSMMSGGEQQRVAIARALVARPSLLLADEPTGDLDEATADALHHLIREMHRAHGLTSVIATHNARLAAVCDRVLRLADGVLAPA